MPAWSRAAKTRRPAPSSPARRGFHDTGLQKDLAHLSYKVKDVDGRPHITLQSECWAQPRQYLPEQISAMVLEQLKKDAEDFLGEKVATSSPSSTSTTSSSSSSPSSPSSPSPTFAASAAGRHLR